MKKEILNTNFQITEAVAWRCSVKNVFLKISEQNTGDGVSFKKALQHQRFPENITKFFKNF